MESRGRLSGLGGGCADPSPAKSAGDGAAGTSSVLDEVPGTQQGAGLLYCTIADSVPHNLFQNIFILWNILSAHMQILCWN